MKICVIFLKEMTLKLRRSSCFKLFAGNNRADGGSTLLLYLRTRDFYHLYRNPVKHAAYVFFSDGHLRIVKSKNLSRMLKIIDWF